MSSTNKTSLGLNMWEASDKPVRNDFVNDNVIIDEEVTNLKKDIVNGNVAIDEKINKLNSNLSNKASISDLANKGIYTGDLNDIPVAANVLTIYRAMNNSVNAPISSYGLVETMYIDSSLFAIQRFTSLDNPPRLFTRRKQSGVWGNWAEK
jgi:hypothetical protein